MRKYQNIESLREKFLTEDEKNVDKILEMIKKVHTQLNEKNVEGNTYISYPIFNKEEIKKYEEIPEVGLSSEEVMNGIVKVMQGQIKWNSSAVLHNINPPITLESVASSCIANIYNPNPLWDFVSSGSQEMEHQIVRQISRMIGWDDKISDGVFTFGGKGCLTYAIKLGLNRALRASAKTGIFGACNKTPIVIASKESHYSIDTACSLLGIGTENCIRVGVNNFGEMDVKEFEIIFNRAVDNGNPIAAIIINGSNTLNNSVDDIERVIDIIKKRENELSYKPYVHFDMVIGWAWLFYKAYDFKNNPLEIKEDALRRIQSLTQKVIKCELADSVGLDFHKIGFAPYISSLFVVKEKKELHSIFKPNLGETAINEFGNNFLQHHTIEHSRSADSILAAWASLQSIGIEGFRKYIANLISVANVFRSELPKYGFDLLNDYSLAFASAFFPHFNGYSFNEVVNGVELVDINIVNNYVYKLFQYIYSGNHKFTKYVLGFLPECGRDHNHNAISGLRVFPMSVHIDEEKAKNMCKELGEIKKQFDDNCNYKEYLKIVAKPTHVPK